MKRSASAVLFVVLLLVIAVHAPQGQQPVLVVVRTSDFQQLSEVAPFVPYHFEDDLAFGEIDQNGLADLQRRGIRHEVVDKSGWSGQYYVVAEGVHGPSLSALPKGRILYTRAKQALVKASPDEALALAHSGYSLQQISRVAKPVPRAATPKISLVPGAFDSTIASIIAEVSADTLQRWVQRLQDFRTRYTYSDSIRKAAQWLYKRYLALGFTDVEFDTFYISGVPHFNVVAAKPGLIYPDSVIMIGGHYDSIVLGAGANPLVWAPGADDNASGTVLALEAARVLACHNFEATLKFAAWDAEEIGLVGSAAYAQKAYRSGRPVSFYLNGDMIGNYNPAAPPRDVVIYTDAASRPFAEFVADMFRTYTTLLPSIPGNSSGSDHRSFQVWGQPAIFVAEGDFSPHWHQPTDVTSNMDFPYMREVVQASVAAIAALAGPADNFGDVPFVKVVAFSVDDDAVGNSQGNGNGYVDAGERLELNLNVRNFGNRPGQGVYCKAHSDDRRVEVVVDSAHVGDVPVGAVLQSQTPVVVALSPALTAGQRVELRVVTRDAAGGMWSDVLKMLVTMPEFAYVAQTVQESTGNADGKIDPGETFTVAVSLKNSGLRPAQHVEAVLRTASPWVTIEDSVAAYPDIGVGQVRANWADRFAARVAPGAPSSTIAFQLEVREGGGFCRATLPLNIAVGQGRILLVEDDGDFALADYYTSALNTLGLNFRYWGTGVEGPVPEDTLRMFTRVIWYTGHYFGHTLYSHGTAALEAYLASGGNLFLNGSMLGLSLKNSTLLRDWLRVAYVNHNTQLHRLVTQGANQVLGSVQFWLSREGGNRQPLPNEVDAIAPGQALLFYDRSTPEGPGTIRSSGAGAVAAEGATYRAVFFGFGWEGIADAQLRQLLLMRILDWLQGTVSDVEEPAEEHVPADFALAPNYPNPFNPGTHIFFALPKAARVQVRVLNSLGQVVRILRDELLPQGYHQVTWDGTDANGVRLASGVYLYQLVVGDVRLTRKCVLLY
ncbi:MAG: M20/M25/M40 family metallo-hydrolase [bacterium]|nr:M20/M25/M40 family metallo-hydrolase [candidate division KSB1 bacterium]MDH7558814.1 M20/M25/M40 family metallo-hydrolase [bacterium]